MYLLLQTKTKANDFLWLQIGASFMSIERTNLGIKIKTYIAEHFRLYFRSPHKAHQTAYL